LLVFILDLGGILPGIVMSLFANDVTSFPWGLLAYPGILSLRGILNGMFCGRLSTALHLGLVRPRLRGNTRYFSELILLQVSLSAFMSLIMSLLICGTMLILGMSRYSSLISAFIVILTTINLATTFTIPLTAFTGFLAFNKGMDPDIVLYPIMSTVADVIVTSWYVIIIQLIVKSIMMGMITMLVTILSVLFIVLGLLRRSSTISFSSTLREIKTLMPLFIFLDILQLITGIFLSNAESKASNVVVPLLSIYPVLIDSIGDLGSIIGSRLTTAIALGYVSDISDMLLLSIMNFVQALSALFLAHTMISPLPMIIMGGSLSIGTIIATILLMDTISSLIIFITAFMITVIASRSGYDPDNFVNPIISTIADMVTTASLLLVIVL